ncbi:MAG: alpha/beta hydrolase [Rhodospirillaceae bacterium]
MSIDHTTLADQVAALAAQGERIETPGPEGPMVWHRFGSRAGRPLMLFHGGWGSWTHWFKAIPTLAEQFTVYAADTPGLGDSAVPSEPHTADGIAAIMGDGITHLLGPDEGFHLAGFSFGGLLGSVVARNMAGRCQSFTAVGASGFGHLHDPPRGTALATPDMTDDEVDDLQRRNLEILMFKDPAKIDDLAIHMHRQNLARGRVRSRPISLTDALLRALPDIKAPIAGIWGEFDATASRPGALEMRAEIFSNHQPNAPFHIIPDAGHWVMYEGAEPFTAALIDVLKSLPPY